ncbi:MAG TPA: hypothetical protein ACN46R_03405, partial [Prochlorococcus sp.]
SCTTVKARDIGKTRYYSIPNIHLPLASKAISKFSQTGKASQSTIKKQTKQLTQKKLLFNVDISSNSFLFEVTNDQNHCKDRSNQSAHQ